MKSMFQIIASLACALALTACGGGGNDAPAVVLPAQPVFTKTDTVVGTGIEAIAGDMVTVHYTGWVYSETATDKKGAQFQTSVGGNPFAFQLGKGVVITGWDQGVVGMKVGGKRTLLIPSSMGYGAEERKDSTGKVIIPANSGLVFEIQVLNITR